MSRSLHQLESPHYIGESIESNETKHKRNPKTFVPQPQHYNLHDPLSRHFLGISPTIPVAFGY